MGVNRKQWRIRTSGLGSAKEIAALSEDSFVNEFAEVMGSEEAAATAYSTAKSVYAAASMALMDMNDTYQANSDSPVLPDGVDFSGDPDDPLSPNLQHFSGLKKSVAVNTVCLSTVRRHIM